MTITPVELLRGICLVFAIGALLAGTVLFAFVQRFVRGWLRTAQRIAGSQASAPPAAVSRLLESAAILRTWQLVCAGIGLGLWWYLGTARGAQFVAAAFRPH